MTSQKSQRKSMDSSRMSQSQSQSAPKLSDGELKELAADVVKFILHRHHENKVAKRSEISTFVIKGKTRKFPDLMEIVKKRFDKCFGMKLVTIGDANKQHALRYTLINKLQEKEDSLPLFNEYETAKQGLLTLLLVFVFMKKEVKEGRLYEFLKNLNLTDHDVLGDVRSLVKEFVDQQYLSSKDVAPPNDPDQKVKVYSWGDHAKYTVSKRDVFRLMGKVYECEAGRWEEMEAYKTIDDLTDDDSDSDANEPDEESDGEEEEEEEDDEPMSS